MKLLPKRIELNLVILHRKRNQRRQRMSHWRRVSLKKRRRKRIRKKRKKIRKIKNLRRRVKIAVMKNQIEFTLNLILIKSYLISVL